jgi:methyl-accepting chemotaxis protein
VEAKTGTPSPAAPATKKRTSLRFKVVGLTGVSAGLVALILVLAFTQQMRGIFQDELEKRGRSVGIELSSNLADSVNDENKDVLQLAAVDTVREIPDAVYVIIRSGTGEVLGKAFGATLGGLDADAVAPPAKDLSALAKEKTTLAGRAVLAVSAPVVVEEYGQAGKKKAVGFVQVGLDLAPMQKELGWVATRAALSGLAVLLLCVLAAYLLARMLTIPLEKLSQAAAGIASGDLRQQISTGGNDEIEELGNSFVTMSAGLRAMLNDLRSAAQEMEREAANILSTSTQQSAMASEQASAINETSTTVSEIAQTSKQATEHADSVIKIAQKSEDLSRDGQHVVEEAMAGLEKLHEQVRAIAQSITDLSERTLQIGDIIATVKDLAEQSNLLALNASI